MRRRQFLLTTLVTAFSCGSLIGPALAHPGSGPHSHEVEVDAEEARLLAKDAVAAKIKEGKLPNSWQTVQPSAAQPKKFGDTLQWLITFDNPAISEAAKRRIFVFIKLNGHLAGINYTGR